MAIRIIPPRKRAKRGLIKFTFSPILTPISDIVKIVTKIIASATHICNSVYLIGKPIPTTKASIEVASARVNRTFVEAMSNIFSFSLNCRPSIIIFIPMIASNEKAIQWSMFRIKRWNTSPSKEPKVGSMTWNIPKKNAKSNTLFLHIHFCNPQVIDTVKQSIDRATPSSIASIINPIVIILFYFVCYFYKFFY